MFEESEFEAYVWREQFTVLSEQTENNA